MKPGSVQVCPVPNCSEIQILSHFPASHSHVCAASFLLELGLHQPSYELPSKLFSIHRKPEQFLWQGSNLAELEDSWKCYLSFNMFILDSGLRTGEKLNGSLPHRAHERIIHRLKGGMKARNGIPFSI